MQTDGDARPSRLRLALGRVSAQTALTPRAGMLADGVLSADLVRAERRAVSARVLTDPEIFRLEMDRIFARTWVYVAHETEIPNPGDFVTRFIGADPVIVTRQKDGALHVLLNVCRHRASAVCRADHGNAVSFRCPYHGWTFGLDGELVGAPWAREAFGPDFDPKQFGLRTAWVASFCGLIFATWDHEGPTLGEHLGEFAFYLEIIFGATKSGLEVCGPPQRWLINCNWKLAADNFSGDGYHTSTLHHSLVELGLIAADDIRAGRFAVNVGDAAKGHGARCNNYLMRSDGPRPSLETVAPIFGIPVELVPEVRERLSAQQQEVFLLGHPMFGNLFPNFGFLNSSTATTEGRGNVALRTIRLWQPRGPDTMEVWSWALVHRDAPQALKDDMRRCVIRSFSSSGIIEQDDAEVWALIQKSVAGPRGRREELLYISDVPADNSNWPGPGTAYPGFAGENLQWNFYMRWREMMST